MRTVGVGTYTFHCHVRAPMKKTSVHEGGGETVTVSLSLSLSLSGSLALSLSVWLSNTLTHSLSPCHGEP